MIEPYTYQNGETLDAPGERLRARPGRTTSLWSERSPESRRVLADRDKRDATGLR